MSAQQFSNCPGCAALLPVGAKACPSCGWTSVAGQPASSGAWSQSAFPVWLCVVLRVVGILLWVASAYALFLWFDLLAARHQPLPPTAAPNMPFPNPAVNSAAAAAAAAANSGAESTAIFTQMIEVLALGLAGATAMWLAAAGDSLRHIERRIR